MGGEKREEKKERKEKERKEEEEGEREGWLRAPSPGLQVAPRSRGDQCVQTNYEHAIRLWHVFVCAWRLTGNVVTSVLLQPTRLSCSCSWMLSCFRQNCPTRLAYLKRMWSFLVADCSARHQQTQFSLLPGSWNVSRGWLQFCHVGDRGVWSIWADLSRFVLGIRFETKPTENWVTTCLNVTTGNGDNKTTVQRIVDAQIVDQKIKKVFLYQRTMTEKESQ